MPSILKFDQWQSTAGANVGTVLQTVAVSDRDYRSASVAADGELNWVSASITRQLPTSKIFIIFSGQYGTSNANDCATRLVSSLDGYLGGGTNTGSSRNVTSITTPGTDKGYGQTAGAGTYSMIPSAFSFLYTPSTAQAIITFTTRIWVESASTVYPNGDGWRGTGQQAHNTGAQIILMEIGA
jgi:hypothetical protein